MLLVSALALINSEKEVLICTRPEGRTMAGVWEFPGGKVEKNETPTQCLIREIKEEISIKITSDCLSPLSFYFDQSQNFDLLLLLYIARKYNGIIKANENQQIKWVNIRKLHKHKMPISNQHFVAVLNDLV